MRTLSKVSLVCAFAACSAVQSLSAGAGSDAQPMRSMSVLYEKAWIHGALDCESNSDPAIEVFRYDRSSYVLRQNKCLSFEAPFIYVLIGEDKVLVLDTGATESAADFPLYTTVETLVAEHAQQGKANERAWLVLHSHSHRDHCAGDPQFEGKPHVTLIEPNGDAVRDFFSPRKWPDEEKYIDLGARKLTIIPTPGHQEEAITVYDSQTKWLLTGDTLYPGYIYVKDWHAYKNSIARLAAFSEAHDVSAMLGGHIEMTGKAGEYYPIGTVYQPDEAGLALKVEHLAALNSKLEELNDSQKIVFDDFVVAPMSLLQKAISGAAKWFFQ